MSYHIKLYLVLINQQKLIYSWDIAKEKFVLIDNGFDIKKFNFNKRYRDLWRSKLKLKKEDIIFCFVGRWNLQKDFQTLFLCF